jgi:hypothetical protein
LGSSPFKNPGADAYQIGGKGQLQAFAGRRFFCLFAGKLTGPGARAKAAYLLLFADPAPYILPLNLQGIPS